MLARYIVFLLPMLFSGQLLSAVVSYELEINSKTITMTDRPVQALAVAGQIPAPTLEARVGDTLRATFHNRLNETTSVHWHGVLLPNDQDGVPVLNTAPIEPGGSFTFEFPVLHAGTYWYHSHTDLQIQRGVYGALVFHKADPQVNIPEEVVVFSDWTNEAPGAVLANLKKDDDYYAFKKNSVQSWDRVIQNGPEAIANRLQSNLQRMAPMDLADVGYDAFLVNGARSSAIAADANAGEMKLRLVNGSTSSYFDVEYAGGPMTLVAADGLDVEPIRVQRLRMSTAETYDVLVPVVPGQALELRATSIDGSGYSSLFVGEGERVSAPDIPRPNLFLSSHADMEMDGVMPAAMHESAGNQHDGAAVHEHQGEVIAHMTDYRHLRARQPSSLPGQRPWRELPVTLTGNMERYVWSFDGLTLREKSQWLIESGENVRMRISNETMMHHPLHLHGHFFRVLNGQGEFSPLKHTVNVPPMGSVVIEFAATEDLDWLFHCHNQYHMKTGMNRVVSYESTSAFDDEMEQGIQPFKRWFARSELASHNSFTELDLRLGDERQEFVFQIDADFDDTYELDASYSYFFGRLFSLFAGLETREHHHETSHTKAIAGFNLTLPLLVESEWRVDDHGEFRLELDSDLQLTRRVGFAWRWNTEEEYRYAFRYHLSKQLSLSLGTDSEYGDGFGLHYLF